MHRKIARRRSPPHSVVWIASAAAILLVDFFSGPYIQLAILFAIPVTLSTWRNGRTWGIATALVLPLLRFVLMTYWSVDIPLIFVAADQVVDANALVGLALLVDRFVFQQRELRVLEGMLPICGFCKRIRSDDQTWDPLESFITERSEAVFSHTFCPDCGLKHYGDIGVDEK